MRLLHSFIMLLAALAVAGGPVAASPPPLPSASVAAARARELADDASGAIADLRTYVGAHPDDTAAARLLGDLYFRIRDLRAAESVWSHTVTMHPDDGPLHVRLGALYAAQNRFADAISQYDADLPNPVAAEALVRLHSRVGDLQRFLDDIADEAEQHRFSPDVLALEANVLQAAHHESEALAVYTRVLTLRHGRCDDLIGRAGDLMALHRTSDAIGDLERCLAIDPDSYAALASLGGAYLARNEYGSARMWVDRALQADPNGAEALIDRGVLEDAAGDWQAAMRDNESAIAADPLRPEGYANLAYDLLERRAVSVAERTAEAGLVAAPGDGRLHFLLARAYQIGGKPAAETRAQYVAALSSDEEMVVRAARSALGSLAAVR